MPVAIKREWPVLADRLVESGRFSTPDDAFDEAFRLLAVEDGKYSWLKAKIDRASAEGAPLSPAEVDGELEAVFRELDAAGSSRA